MTITPEVPTVDLSREFFHVCDRRYTPGTVKPPGTYGALASAAPAQEVADDPLGEHLRERVREEHYPHKPSRFASTFVWESLQDAKDFRDNLRPGAHIYRVRFINPSAAVHRICFTAFRMPSSSLEPPATVLAHDFWRSLAVYEQGNEVFAESAVEILGIA